MMSALIRNGILWTWFKVKSFGIIPKPVSRRDSRLPSYMHVGNFPCHLSRNFCDMHIPYDPTVNGKKLRLVKEWGKIVSESQT